MLTIELDYENSKEKLIKSFNKKIPGKRGFWAIFGWMSTAPTRCERAQTGAFLAVTEAVCGDGVELVCVQLLYRE